MQTDNSNDHTNASKAWLVYGYLLLWLASYYLTVWLELSILSIATLGAFFPCSYGLMYLKGIPGVPTSRPLILQMVFSSFFGWLAVAAMASYLDSTAAFLIAPFYLVGYSWLLWYVFQAGYSSTRTHVDRTSKLVSWSKSDAPMVSFLIPVRNEPEVALRMTLRSAVETEYPQDCKKYVVADNSTEASWGVVQRVVADFRSEGHDVILEHREGVEGFKPANLEMGLDAHESDYVVMLDVDSTLRKDSLASAILKLESDQELAFVNFVIRTTNANTNSLSKFYSPANEWARVMNYSRPGFEMFWGHNGVWRRSDVEEVRPLVEYQRGVIVSEDLVMAVKAHLNGRRAETMVIESGDWVPGTLAGVRSMWSRWTYGSVQVAAHFFARLYSTRTKRWATQADTVVFMMGVPVFALLLAMTYLAVFLQMVFLDPPEMLRDLTGAIPMYGVFLLSGFAVFGYFGASALHKNTYEGRRPRIWLMYFLSLTIFSGYIAWIALLSLFRYLFGRKSGWKITPKSNGRDASPIGSTVIRHLSDIAGIVVGLGVPTAWILFRAPNLSLVAIDNIVWSMVGIPSSLAFLVAFYGRQTSGVYSEEMTIDSAWPLRSSKTHSDDADSPK